MNLAFPPLYADGDCDTFSNLIPWARFTFSCFIFTWIFSLFAILSSLLLRIHTKVINIGQMYKLCQSWEKFYFIKSWSIWPALDFNWEGSPYPGSSRYTLQGDSAHSPLKLSDFGKISLLSQTFLKTSREFAAGEWRRPQLTCNTTYVLAPDLAAAAPARLRSC